jgi:DNA repair protein RecO (recombination protein O)
MPLVSDRCICVRKFEYSETSQILTLLSRGHGLLRVMAKGAHRRTKAGSSRFDGGADLLDSGQAVFTNDTSKDLATLTEWKLLEGHLELRQNLRGIYLGLYAAELICALFEEHDVHERLFDRTEWVLGELAGNRREEAFLAFELDLLREAGFSPQLEACVGCGSMVRDREAVYFSPARGGLVCANCSAVIPDRIEVDGRLLRLLRTMQSAGGDRLPQLTRYQTDPLNRLLAEQVEHAVGKRLRMPPYVVVSESGRPQMPMAAGAKSRV